MVTRPCFWLHVTHCRIPPLPSERHSVERRVKWISAKRVLAHLDKRVFLHRCRHRVGLSSGGCQAGGLALRSRYEVVCVSTAPSPGELDALACPGKLDEVLKKKSRIAIVLGGTWVRNSSEAASLDTVLGPVVTYNSPTTPAPAAEMQSLSKTPAPLRKLSGGKPRPRSGSRARPPSPRPSPPPPAGFQAGEAI